jgi:hypothetical protein
MLDGLERKEKAMHTFRRCTIAAVAAVSVVGVAPASAVADEPLGQHIAMCAQQLGQRADPPAVTCTHDDMTMTFATFGEMVEHMRTMH